MDSKAQRAIHQGRCGSVDQKHSHPLQMVLGVFIHGDLCLSDWSKGSDHCTSPLGRLQLSSGWLDEGGHESAQRGAKI